MLRGVRIVFQQQIDINLSRRSGPQGNGEIERQNRSLLKAIKIAQIMKKDWQSLSSTPDSTMGFNPAKLLIWARGTDKATMCKIGIAR